MLFWVEGFGVCCSGGMGFAGSVGNVAQEKWSPRWIVRRGATGRECRQRRRGMRVLFGVRVCVYTEECEGLFAHCKRCQLVPSELVLIGELVTRRSLAPWLHV